jgi:hypothetical protein
LYQVLDPEGPAPSNFSPYLKGEILSGHKPYAALQQTPLISAKNPAASDKLHNFREMLGGNNSRYNEMIRSRGLPNSFIPQDPLFPQLDLEH